LDELPQLIDVLQGTMSLVGPRPEVPHYVKYYPPEVAKVIFQVKPGITDFASIRMIDENQILATAANPEQAYIDEILPQKLNYALKYVNEHNLLLDLYLIVLTVAKIITR
jgi:lipopolysaccharide/colanic/teichoic acid biosynthesis glycosyltransferase